MNVKGGRCVPRAWYIGHGRDPHKLCWDICCKRDTVTQALPAPMGLELNTCSCLRPGVHLSSSKGLAACTMVLTSFWPLHSLFKHLHESPTYQREKSGMAVLTWDKRSTVQCLCHLSPLSESFPSRLRGTPGALRNHLNTTDAQEWWAKSQPPSISAFFRKGWCSAKWLPRMPPVRRFHESVISCF